jgi:hypothetical protein
MTTTNEVTKEVDFTCPSCGAIYSAAITGAELIAMHERRPLETRVEHVPIDSKTGEVRLCRPCEAVEQAMLQA